MVSLRGLFRKRKKPINTSKESNVKAQINGLEDIRGMLEGRAAQAGISLSRKTLGNLRNGTKATNTAAGRHYYQALEKILKMAREQEIRYWRTGNLGTGPLTIVQTNKGPAVDIRANYKGVVQASREWQPTPTPKPTQNRNHLKLANALRRKKGDVNAALERFRLQRKRLEALPQTNQVTAALKEVYRNMLRAKELKHDAGQQLKHFANTGELQRRSGKAFPFAIKSANGRLRYHPEHKRNVVAMSRRFANRDKLLPSPTEWFGNRVNQVPPNIKELMKAPHTSLPASKRAALKQWIEQANQRRAYERNDPVPRIRRLLDAPANSLTANNRAFLNHWTKRTQQRGVQASYAMDWERKLLRRLARQNQA